MDVEKQEQYKKPCKDEAVFYIAINTILYLIPPVFLVTIGILNIDDSTFTIWIFLTSSLMLVYIASYWMNLLNEAKYTRTVTEKSEILSEERYLKTKDTIEHHQLLMKMIFYLL
ncbi:hypothetical protein CRE_05092 [Caenorhabditis remanei]|uniref:Uncharacterized protein n=1 Tax=Caenorhabditis remanei TaxID=31234 RepID=E3MZ53_CAERE|nr:hypothetical protein CRE_05092 [Caenorhabditis remanei]